MVEVKRCQTGNAGARSCLFCLNRNLRPVEKSYGRAHDSLGAGCMMITTLVSWQVEYVEPQLRQCSKLCLQYEERQAWVEMVVVVSSQVR